MNAKTQRTPGPWSMFGPIPYQIYGGDPQRRIAVVDYIQGNDTAENADNAAFIVTACNAHDDLVAALRALLGMAERLDNIVLLADERRPDCCADILRTARVALAKVAP